MSLGDKVAASWGKIQEADLRHQATELELIKEMKRFQENQNIMHEIGKLKKSRDEAIALNKEYEKLLSKPMAEIAAHKLGKNFKPTFSENQKQITNFIVARQAYKEMAIQYGLELDKTREEVIFEANKQKVFVIENLTNPANETGMGDLADFPELKEAAIAHAKSTYKEASKNFEESVEKKRVEDEISARGLIDPVFKENRRREAAEKAAAEKAAAEKAAAEKAAAEKAAEEARKKSYEDAKKAAAEYDRKMEEQKAAAKKAAAEKDLAEKTADFVGE